MNVYISHTNRATDRKMDIKTDKRTGGRTDRQKVEGADGHSSSDFAVDAGAKHS